MTAPLFSVITVCRNSGRTISDCIESVTHQDRACEHIFVDGASEDDTTAIIRATASSDSILISAPDTGIYDAMNKGLRLARGEIIGLLNSDDFYAHKSVLSKVAEVLENPKIDCCYGDLIMTEADRPDRTARYWRAGPYDSRLFYWGWMPPHPTFFVRRRFYEELGGFRLDLQTSADYELMLRFLLKHSLSAAYIPETLIVMRRGGASNATLVARRRAHGNDHRAWAVNNLRPRLWTVLCKPLRKLPQFWATPPDGQRPSRWWKQTLADTVQFE